MAGAAHPRPRLLGRPEHRSSSAATRRPRSPASTIRRRWCGSRIAARRCSATTSPSQLSGGHGATRTRTSTSLSRSSCSTSCRSGSCARRCARRRGSRGRAALFAIYDFNPSNTMSPFQLHHRDFDAAHNGGRTRRTSATATSTRSRRARLQRRGLAARQALGRRRLHEALVRDPWLIRAACSRRRRRKAARRSRTLDPIFIDNPVLDATVHGRGARRAGLDRARAPHRARIGARRAARRALRPNPSSSSSQGCGAGQAIKAERARFIEDVFKGAACASR